MCLRECKLLDMTIPLTQLFHAQISSVMDKYLCLLTWGHGGDMVSISGAHMTLGLNYLKILPTLS